MEGVWSIVLAGGCTVALRRAGIRPGCILEMYAYYMARRVSSQVSDTRAILLVQARFPLLSLVDHSHEHIAKQTWREKNCAI